ncbi:MAG: uroporphyrinogen decarboxylase family protein [Anaerolineae bacterium]
MTPREIVEATLTYAGPERVAHSFEPSDFVHAGNTVETKATDWRKTGANRWERIDEWGNVWGRVDPTSKGEVIRGVLDDLEDVDTYVFPDYSDPADYDSVRERRAATLHRWLIGGMPGFTFNIARKMRRFEQYLMDIVLERDRIVRLHNRIDEMLVTMIRNYAEAGVDSVMFPEDWGTQKQTLINPKLWREEFFPRFRRLCGVAHDAGIRVFMHSCGQIEGIVPSLIEAGVDLLQFDQPDLHGIDTLAEHQETAKITFWCPVDIQKTLQTRDRDVIEAKVKEMLDKLWRGRGGFVAGYYGDNASIGLDPKWQDFASKAFLKYGRRGRYT